MKFVMLLMLLEGRATETGLVLCLAESWGPRPPCRCQLSGQGLRCALSALQRFGVTELRSWRLSAPGAGQQIRAVQALSSQLLFPGRFCSETSAVLRVCSYQGLVSLPLLWFLLSFLPGT